MSKQTAVEWLMHELRWEGFIEDGDDLILIEHKALAMEREQIEQAYGDGLNAYRVDFCNRNEYYERTYGKEAGNANG